MKAAAEVLESRASEARTAATAESQRVRWEAAKKEIQGEWGTFMAVGGSKERAGAAYAAIDSAPMSFSEAGVARWPAVAQIVEGVPILPEVPAPAADPAPASHPTEKDPPSKEGQA